MAKKKKLRPTKRVKSTLPKETPKKNMTTAQLGLTSFRLHSEIQTIQNQANLVIAKLRQRLANIGTELEKRDRAEKG